ncbi:glycosyltransferase [Xylophilus rhododendri]|uniref:Glycosyltransferase n=1 Tax=Xylophilus rhododendri TaxID=2697032 RepID=A0A857JAC5_9BURK|nr:glycosyltransferase [Xylophilus rhododendri]QHJ00164.1 glycosyltransferase [Xylophilus rhododendri]
MSKHKPKIVVLMATFNGEQWIKEQIDSIVVQENVDVSIYVSDDHSLDATLEIVNGLVGTASLTFLAKADASGSAGSNFRRLFRDVDVSSFDYVALADQDDVWHPLKLIEAVTVMARDRSAGYSGAVDSFWLDGRRKVVRQNGHMRAGDFLFEGAGQGCTFVVRADLFLLVQDFLRRHHELAESLHYHDWLIYLLARAHGLRWTFDTRAWIAYRQHGSNEIGSRGGWRGARSRLAKIRSGWYRTQIAAAMQAYLAADPANVFVQRAQRVFSQPMSLGRRLQFAKLSVLHGRRRKSDRIVVLVAALMGWI